MTGHIRLKVLKNLFRKFPLLLPTRSKGGELDHSPRQERGNGDGQAEEQVCEKGASGSDFGIGQEEIPEHSATDASQRMWYRSVYRTDEFRSSGVLFGDRRGPASSSRHPGIPPIALNSITLAPLIGRFDSLLG